MTAGPSVDSGPGVIGIPIVVSCEGLNWPSIHTETSPECGSHCVVPRLVTVFEDSNATVRTSLAGATPRFSASSVSVSSRTVRSASISKRVPE